VRDRDGKAGRNTSTAKDLKSVLNQFAHTTLLKPSVPCVIIVVHGTWMIPSRHPSAISRAFSCWTKICSERVLKEPFLQML
jgi:hypothetical protein